MIVENLNDLEEVVFIIFLKAISVKISHTLNFNPVFITLWYENNIIIFFLSIVMDSDERETMNVTIVTFNDSLLGNTANDTAGFSSAKYIIFGGP